MKHFETSWELSDGLELYAQGWTPEKSYPRAVICLVHGIGEHTLRFIHVAEALTDKGFALFGADLRGHGRSGGPRGHFPSIEAVNNDIDLLIARAKKEFPEIPVILYGHSLGGILVLHYILKRKPEIRGAIVTSPGLRTSIEEQHLKVIAAKVLGSLIPRVSIANGLKGNSLTRDTEVVKLYRTDPLVHNRITLGFGKIMMGVVHWTLEHAGEFPIPLLLMHGKDDKIAFPSGSIEFAAALDGRCKLVLWENGYHELHNEPDKAEVFRTMTTFLDNLLQ